MARIRKNSLLAGISGQIGKEIIIKQYADKVVVSKYPDMSKVKASAAQKKSRRMFTEAMKNISAIKRDPKLRKRFEKGLKPGENLHQKIKQYCFDQLKK